MRTTAALAATLLAVHLAAVAGPVPVSLVADDFNGLLATPPTAVGVPLVTNMSLGLLQAEVVSQAFTDGAGSYAYLYQVYNTGTEGNSVVEAFTLSPFFGVSGATTLGYLTANAPTGFTLGDQSPYAASADAVAGPTVSFAFPAFIAGAAIDPGEDSMTLYVLSDTAPGLIRGNVINGTVGTGDVVGPVPEPATMTLLTLGALAALRGARRRRG